MLRITRHVESGTTALVVCGRIGAEQLGDLSRSIDDEREHDVVLDLGDVTLVDVKVVRFLVQCETRGIRMLRCPAYVREWMTREQGFQEAFMSHGRTVDGVKNVVLVHGGFVDGSGWQGVYDVLKKDG